MRRLLVTALTIAAGVAAMAFAGTHVVSAATDHPCKDGRSCETTTTAPPDTTTSTVVETTTTSSVPDEDTTPPDTTPPATTPPPEITPDDQAPPAVPVAAEPSFTG